MLMLHKINVAKKHKSTSTLLNTWNCQIIADFGLFHCITMFNFNVWTSVFHTIIAMKARVRKNFNNSNIK